MSTFVIAIVNAVVSLSVALVIDAIVLGIVTVDLQKRVAAQRIANHRREIHRRHLEQAHRVLQAGRQGLALPLFIALAHQGHAVSPAAIGDRAAC